MANKGNRDNKKQKENPLWFGQDKFFGPKPKTKREKRDAKKYFKRVGKQQKKFMRDTPLHAGMNAGLDLNLLTVASVMRSEDPKGFNHKLSDWSVLEWGGATGGECGEAQNVAKKILRIRKKLRGNVKKGDSNMRKLKHKLAIEIADSVQYHVLWAASEGIDLSAAIVESFNAKSDEIGYPYKLPVP